MGRKNSFDFLRILAATAVILSHSYALIGVQQPYFLGHPLGAWGVNTFFIISGYLLAGTNDFTVRYFWKRGLRIIPALTASVIIAILVIGPLVTTLSLSDYFRNPATLAFISRIGIFFGKDQLPGVFENNPFPNAVNGSIWMLPYLTIMYFTLYMYKHLGILNNKQIMIFIYVFAWAMLQNTDVTGSIGIISTMYLWYWYLFFFGGVMIYMFSDHVTLSYKAFVISILFYIFAIKFNSIEIIQYIALPITVVSFASIKNNTINNIGKYGDFSYGMFVFAFPIQQTIVHFWPSIGPIQMFIFSWFATLGVAVLSWNVIEQPALKLRNIYSKASQ